jgi:hypothetical protein
MKSSNKDACGVGDYLFPGKVPTIPRDLPWHGQTRGNRTFIAYSLVTDHPGSTARELDSKQRNSEGTIRKRLSELEKRSRIKRGTPKRCGVTGRMSQTWWPCPESEVARTS